MSTQTLTGPYSLRQRLYNATQQASESLEKMTFEQRREAGRKAHLRFTTKNACIFSKNSKTMTRQRKKQIALSAEGLCCICAKPKVSKNFCTACREKNRNANIIRYRTKVGIPLDAPLSKRGRPRHP